MSFSIKNIDHVVLCVSDMEKSVQFYCEVLGCVVERSVDSIPLVQLRAGRSLVDLMGTEPNSRESTPNMDHFALRIEPFDETSLRKHLQKHGVKVGDVVSRYGAEGQGPSLYIQDPDGNTVELKGPPNLS